MTPAVNHNYDAGEQADARAAGIDLPKLDKILSAIRAEFVRAVTMHKTGMHSMHEAYGVILEEFQEFWAEVRIDDDAAARVELIQVAAMAVRALHDVPVDTRTPKPRPFSKAELVALRAFLHFARAESDDDFEAAAKHEAEFMNAAKRT